MSVVGFFVLLGIAIGVRFLGNRLVPLAMPSLGRIKTVGLGWLGGLTGSLLARFLLPWGPRVAGIYVAAAALGAAAFLLGWGVIPFFNIFLGRTRKSQRAR